MSAGMLLTGSSNFPGLVALPASSPVAARCHTCGTCARLHAPRACDYEDFGDSVEFESALARYRELGLLGQAARPEVIDEEDDTTPEEMVVRASQSQTPRAMLEKV